MESYPWFFVFCLVFSLFLRNRDGSFCFVAPTAPCVTPFVLLLRTMTRSSGLRKPTAERRRFLWNWIPFLTRTCLCPSCQTLSSPRCLPTSPCQMPERQVVPLSFCYVAGAIAAYLPLPPSPIVRAVGLSICMCGEESISHARDPHRRALF